MRKRWNLRRGWGDGRISFIAGLCACVHASLFSPTPSSTPDNAGGDLHYHLTQHGTFSESEVRFYGAELILGLEHLHRLNIVYRDLKVRLEQTAHPLIQL